MKINICIIIFCLFIANSMSSCNDKEEFFEDPELLEEWYLARYADADGNLIIEKPDSMPRDIMLVFRKEGRLTGHIVTYSFFDSKYIISPDGEMTINLSRPRLPTLYEWDEIFIETIARVNAYEYTGGNILKLYYDNSANYMLFKNTQL